MRIVNSILTKSDCYRTGRKITVKGLMIHSVGVGQPNPLVFIKNWNRSGISKGVHGFIGATGIVYQTLPWNHRAWHAGASANNTHIGVEMTEPTGIKYTGGSNFVFDKSNLPAIQAHVRAAYGTAVELFAFLAKQYNLNPLADGVIVSHAEGYRRGIASNHGDPEHLWRQTGVGFTMNGFRKDVQRVMLGASVAPTPTPKPTPSQPTKSEETKQLQTDLTELGFPPKGGIDGFYGDGTKGSVEAFQRSKGLEVDGLAGPITKTAIKKALEEKRATASAQAEKLDGYVEVIYRGAEGLNLRKAPNLSNASIVGVAKVGSVYRVQSKSKDFYGLTNGQYISSNSKYVRFDKVRNYKKTTSNLNLRTGASTNYKVLLVIPKSSDVMVVENKGSWSRVVYNSTEGWVSNEYLTSTPTKPVIATYLVKIDTPVLNIREGATTGSKIVGSVKANEVYTIIETKNGWGKLKSGLGWIYLDYTTKL